jgi:hypothetical protein
MSERKSTAEPHTGGSDNDNSEVLQLGACPLFTKRTPYRPLHLKSTDASKLMDSTNVARILRFNEPRHGASAQAPTRYSKLTRPALKSRTDKPDIRLLKLHHHSGYPKSHPPKRAFRIAKEPRSHSLIGHLACPGAEFVSALDKSMILNKLLLNFALDLGSVPGQP